MNVDRIGTSLDLLVAFSLISVLGMSHYHFHATVYSSEDSPKILRTDKFGNLNVKSV